MPALTAHHRLGLRVEGSKMRGELVTTDAESFSNLLAVFYASLLQAPNVCAEGLVDGFEEYNGELLAWFNG